MKDLKHLIYFENLLENANNELVRQAQQEGMLALGYTCYHMPEVLLNVDNCFAVRMRAPNTGSIDVASYYMSNYTCEYCRALLERAIEGGYNFLDGICGVDACAQMNRQLLCHPRGYPLQVHRLHARPLRDPDAEPRPEHDE